jgi:hypothetical protein
MRAYRLLGVAAIGIAAISCASRAAVVATEVPGTPSSTGCDAWFGGRNSSSPQLNQLRFTLENRSSHSRCVAKRVQLLFRSAVQLEGIRVVTPTGWQRRELTCASGPGWCGYEWSATNVGVPAGGRQAGFEISYVPADQPDLKSWIVDLGSRRVEMPIGTVGAWPDPVGTTG